MAEQTRAPFAAYGPAEAGYGPARAVAPPAARPGQPSDGAPSTPEWPGPRAAGPPTPPPAGRPGPSLGIISLALAILGTFTAFSPSAWVLAWASLLAGLILAIVHLSRRGTAPATAVTALVVGVIGILIALVVAVIAGLTSSLSSDGGDPVQDDYALAERLVVDDGGDPATSRQRAWDTAVLIEDAETGDDIWSIRALTPVDVTAEAADATPAPIPLSGSFIAVPFEVTNLSDAPIDPDDWQFLLPTDYISADGSSPEGVYDPAFAVGFPSRYDLTESIAPKQTVVFFEIRDAAAADAASGTAELWLYSGESVEWSSEVPDDSVPG